MHAVMKKLYFSISLRDIRQHSDSQHIYSVMYRSPQGVRRANLEVQICH